MLTLDQDNDNPSARTTDFWCHIYFYFFYSNEKEQSPYLELARAGVRTMLSFAFSILQRAWRKGEDTDICSALLTESLETLQKLPEGLLFNKAESSPIWEDVLDKASKFLENVVLGYVLHFSLRNPKNFRTCEPFKVSNARFFYPY